MSDAADPVGLAEIAERLGVARQTAKDWNLKQLLPAPKWTVSRNPAWEWSDVERWAKETGRYPTPLGRGHRANRRSQTLPFDKGGLPIGGMASVVNLTGAAIHLTGDGIRIAGTAIEVAFDEVVADKDDE